MLVMNQNRCSTLAASLLPPMFLSSLFVLSFLPVCETLARLPRCFGFPGVYSHLARMAELLVHGDGLRNLRIEEDGVILMMLVDFHFPKKRLLSKTEKRFKMKFSVDKYCVPTCSVLEPQCNNARAKRVRIVFCDRVWRDQPRGKTKGGAAPEVFSRG